MSMGREEVNQLLRWIAGVLTSITIIWSASGWVITPIAKAMAKDAFKELLVADQAFIDLDAQVKSSIKKVDDLDHDLVDAKKQIDKIVQQTDSLERTGNETKCLVQKLVNKELGITSSALPC